MLKRLGTGPDGLDSAEAQRRHDGHGTGGGDTPAGGGLLRAFLDELSNPLTPVLAAGAVLSASFGSLVDAALVGSVVGGSALVGAVHERNTERSLAELLSRSAVTARVRRDGAERVVAAEDLVLGDVIALEPGDSVPADCRVLEPVRAGGRRVLADRRVPAGRQDQPTGGRRGHRRPALDAVRGHHRRRRTRHRSRGGDR